MRDAISRLDMREKSIPQRITVIFFFFFFFFNLSKKNIYLFFFFMVMVNLGSTDGSRYTGYREITDRDVLDLQCNGNSQVRRSSDWCRKSLILILLRKLIWFDRHWLNIY